ncbi:MAG: transcriptional regulator [Pseudomonadota bacterium]
MHHDRDLLLRSDILTNWQDHYSEVFSEHTLILQHRLQDLPHFRRENLIALIEKAPDDVYDLVRMGAVGSNKHQWRRGFKEGTSGEDILTAIEEGRFWISLQGLQDWDEGFAQVTEKIFADIARKVPTFKSFKHKTGMLISSPGAQVYYHMDIPGQSLWQIQGEKDVYVYPNSEPFLKDKQMENVFLGVTEEEIEYHDWYDDFADKITLKPGMMAHWPLNCPHRVENHDMVNISLTTEHYTKEIRDHYVTLYANGILRGMGISPEKNSAGASKYAKMAIAAAHKMVFRKVVKAKSPKAPRSFKINLKGEDFMEDASSAAG